MITFIDNAMIQIKDKSKCCGCNACGDVCAHNAITFKTDIEGFFIVSFYKKIKKKLCLEAKEDFYAILLF